MGAQRVTLDSLEDGPGGVVGGSRTVTKGGVTFG